MGRLGDCYRNDAVVLQSVYEPNGNDPGSAVADLIVAEERGIELELVGLSNQLHDPVDGAGLDALNTRDRQ